jgi:Fur family ferric uptake transcriptional regulator
MPTTPARDRFEQFVREHRGRLTPQRQFIVKEFLALNGHYDIQELYEHFRTLKLLVQAGIAGERHFANGNTKYEVNVAHHDHVICLACNKIVEFDSPKLEGMQARIVKDLGFEMAFHKHEIYGYCRDCRKKKSS